MRKALDIIINFLTLGKEDQSFLDANWIARLLKWCPKKYKRELALTVLSWSPHYFYRKSNPEYVRLSHSEFVKKEFERNLSTREKLCSCVLSPHLKSAQTVMDYGCGPGFLAKIVSRRTHAVYGVDLSRGVLECARTINGSTNITFLHTSQLEEIKDDSIDLVYSFAVIQHVTDYVFVRILDAMSRKLKKGGKLLIHIVLDGDVWKTEQDWKRDTSLKGRLKLKCGLNFFKRDENDVRSMLESAHYTSIVIQSMRELCPEKFDDVCDQHLVCAVK